MPYENIDDGLYIISQPSIKNGIAIEHFGILDIGNMFQHPDVDGSHPVIFHQTPPQLRADLLRDTGRWNIIGRIEDVAGANERLQAATMDPDYELFGNNCEHFARFIAHGERYSKQIFWAGVGAMAIGALAVYVYNNAK